MFTTADIVYKHFNERDVEEPALIDALRQAMPVRSFLDVGANYSWYTYAPMVRVILNQAADDLGGRPKYTACDVLDCAQTRAIVDHYNVGNVVGADLEPHDFVACVSTIEHSGISTYKNHDVTAERFNVFDRLVSLARKHLFVTFPFGREGLYENEYANVTPTDLFYFAQQAKAKGLTDVSVAFFYTEFAQGQKPWEEITYEQAKDIPMDKALGCQCVCIFHAKAV